MQQPLFAPVQSLLESLQAHDAPPDIHHLNRLASQYDLKNARGQRLQFVAPHGSGLAYEERIWWLGEIETRPGNWHDAFNALVWLTFPRIKAAINHGHHESLAAQRHVTSPTLTATLTATSTSRPKGQRGALRDALTQFDECGVIVASSELHLWKELCAHRWKEVFWEQRHQVQQHLRVFVFGHATYELLRHPHLGLCGKAVFLHVDEAWLSQTIASQCQDIDQRLAQRFHPDALNGYRTPKDFHPIPLLGIPGATPENESALYYENTRQFRPLRTVP